MGRFLIADSVVGIIAQRLVRRLCPACKIEYTPDVDECELLNVDPADPPRIYRPGKCKLCDDTGYKGRIGVYEIMPISRKIAVMISEKATADEIENQAVREGMVTLRQAAAEYVLQGITTVSEMQRVAYEDL